MFTCPPSCHVRVPINVAITNTIVMVEWFHYHHQHQIRSDSSLASLLPRPSPPYLVCRYLLTPLLCATWLKCILYSCNCHRDILLTLTLRINFWSFCTQNCCTFIFCSYIRWYFAWLFFCMTTCTYTGNVCSICYSLCQSVATVDCGW